MNDRAITTYADELRAARALIDTPEKWARGVFEDGARRCPVRALRDAGVSFLAKRFLYLVLDQKVNGYGLVSWNDRKGRTHSEVMDLFDRAIVRAESS